MAATLTASIAVPALLVQVGALDAVGHELATPAPNSTQIVVATSQAKPVAVPHRVARQARAAARPQDAVVRSRTRAIAPPRATRISTPVSSAHSAPVPTPVTPSTPSSPPPTTTTPTPATPSTPSTSTTPTTTTPTTTTVPPFTTVTVPPAEPPITAPPPPKIVVVNVPPPLGTDVFNDGNPIAVAVTVKANIYAPPPVAEGQTP